MGFPAGVQTVTVAAPANGFRTLDGAYQTGTITLTPTVREVVSAEHGIIAVGEVNFTIGASGTFTPREVLPVDAEGFSPSGWTYRLDRALTGEAPRSYNVSIPASAGSVDLSTLLDVEASDGTVVYGPAAPNGPAGGDLSGSYPNPTVARLNGVTVSGSPAVGQVPTATSSTTATWQTPTGGGGGGGTPADTVTSETAYGQAASAGTAGTYSRGDHTHGSPSLSSSAASTSAVGAAATAGSASTAARADHVHGRESFGAVTTQTSFGAASGNGTATTPARSDHTHGTPSLPSASTSVAGVVQLDGTAADIQALGVQAAGSTGKAADAGHVHPTTGLVLSSDPRLTDNRTPSGSASGDLSGSYPGPTVAKVNGVAVSGTPSSGQVLTASSGSAASWQSPAVVPSASSSVVSETSYSQASGAGSAATFARGDHTHGTPALPTPSAIGAVALTGDEVIYGEKTYADRIIVLPGFDAAFANQAVRLAQMRAEIAAAVAGVSGGAPARTARVRITDDDLSGLPSASSWTIVQTSAGTKLQCSIAAAAGDRIELFGNFMYKGAHFLDWALLDSGGAIALYASTESSSPGSEGNPTMYPSTSFDKLTTSDMFTVASGHISSGMVTIALAHQGTSAGTVYAHSVYPWRLRLKNIGAEPA